MLKFKEFKEYLLLNEEQNTHMEHIEDLVFNEGVDGTRRAINFLRDLRDMLAGNSKSKIQSTVKWDGCVHEDTIVKTTMGDMSIKEIVNREDLWGELEIYGTNLKNSLQYDSTSILIAGNKNEEGTKDWVEITLEDGTILKVTEDHQFFTNNRGWVEAKNLNETDDIKEL